MTDQTSEHLATPWRAILADEYGVVYDSVEQALSDVGDDEEFVISVRRGSALPVESDGRLPSTYRSGDIACQIEAYLVDKHDKSVGAAARYAQAKAMAAGLNAAASADTEAAAAQTEKADA